MKISISVASLALLVAGGMVVAAPAVAQAAPQASASAAPSAADRAKTRTNTVDQAVGGLTADEKAKIQAIYEKAYAQQDALKAQGKSGESVRDLLEDADSAAKKELTDAQKAKWPRMRITG